MMVPIENIRSGNRLRQVRPEHVAHLAESIARIGLQSPISVHSGVAKRENGGSDISFELVAGLHRLEACKSLGLVEIEAAIVQMDSDERALWEIDENLCRAELTELERGEHLLRRKELYERKWPDSKAGAAQAAGMNRAVGNNVGEKFSPTFTEDTAAKIGITDRTVQKSISRARRIDERVRDRVRTIPDIADSGVELDALAKMEPAQQKRAVALVEAGSATGIRDAGRLMRPTKEAQIRALRERDAAAATLEPPESRFGIADELEQVLRMLRGDRSRIGQIPLAKRVALARGCLKLLDVGLDDLKPIGGAP